MDRQVQGALLAVVATASSSAGAESSSTGAERSFPDPALLPERMGMPDPLIGLDGSRAKDVRDWNEKRKPELRALFEHYMYGKIPARPEGMRFVVESRHPDLLGGKAILELVSIRYAPDGTAGAPRIDLMLIAPAVREGRVPVFLALNFCGNHAVIEDPRVPLTRNWVKESCGGKDGRATEAGRGTQAGDWPVDEIIRRGYALASFATADLDSDRAEVAGDLPSWLARKGGEDPGRAGPADRGTLALWASGFHRAVDYLVTRSDIDPARIAVVGHSRNGKTALLAAAFDERIALAIPHQAGCGGTAPSRGTVGESVKQINEGFPHWFNGQFKKFNDAPARLPFDQNCLAALCAPRPILFSNAEKDIWANPAGQLETLRGAESVYRLLGAGGLEGIPEPGKLSGGALGYFIRPGEHSMTREDWKVFLDFADRHLKGRSP